MLQIETKYQPLVLEALEELMYKISLQLEELKGGPLTKQRKTLTKKQRDLEKMQHQISNSVDK